MTLVETLQSDSKGGKISTPRLWVHRIHWTGPHVSITRHVLNLGPSDCDLGKVQESIVHCVQKIRQ